MAKFIELAHLEDLNPIRNLYWKFEKKNEVVK